jgi:hypothetical protein
MAMRKALVFILVALACALLAPPAMATFHLIKISEIRAATTATPFVELKMYSPGQTHLMGHTLTTYNALGDETQPPFVFPSNPPEGDNQRTILIAPGPVEGVTPDFSATLGFSTPGGAVCFDVIDCVSYGSFSGSSLTSPAGTPFAAYPDADRTLSLTRTLARGCATALDPADDTDDSAADFAVTAPTPRNNSTTPTETVCSGGGGGDTNAPETTITKHPAKRSDKTKAKFKFTASENGSSFECKLDKKPFKGCSSPQKYKHLKPGKHKFRVRATDSAGNTDATPAKYKFKVLTR